MKQGIETFWLKHGTTIAVIGVTVIGIAVSMNYAKKLIPMMDSKNNFVRWKSENMCKMGLDGVMKVLKANKDIYSYYAIVREGLDDYIVVGVSDNVVMQ